MKRFIRAVSLVLVFAFAASLCSCTVGMTPPSEVTTTTASETASETTPAPTPTPEPTPTPTPIPTPTPTPTPVPENHTTKALYKSMVSALGQKQEKARAILEKFYGTTLGDANISKNYDGKEEYIYYAEIMVDGILFKRVSITTAKGKDKVVFIALGNPDLSEDEMKQAYKTLNAKLKSLYGKPTGTISQKTVADTVYRVNKKKKQNAGTGYYLGDGQNYWLNITGN